VGRTGNFFGATRIFPLNLPEIIRISLKIVKDGIGYRF